MTDVDGLSPKRRALFELLMKERSSRSRADGPRAAGSSPAPAGSVPPLRPEPRDGDLPLSFAQQRLWFLDQLEPGTIAYNIPCALRFEGALNETALERAFAEVVRRHESLRTTFVQRGAHPAQVVHPPPATSGLERVDLSDLPRERAREEAFRRAIAEAARPFDLTTGPLLRTTSLKLGPKEHVLLMTMHHIVSDGWSIGVLVRELSLLYRAFAAGRPSPLADLTIQYADFARWQRRWLTGDVLAAQLAYWTKQLGGGLRALDLPTDHPRPARPTLRGATHVFRIAPALSESLRALARRRGATLFMTLLAAFDVLLHRYTQQRDFTVGTPIANRNRTEIEGLIGFFVNTLVLRADLSGDPTFTELLHRVRETTLGAYAHQDVPFERLVEVLEPARDWSRPPLFQVMFVLHNEGGLSLQLPDLVVSPLEVHADNAKFDLVVGMEEHTTGGMEAWFEYNADLFDPATIARMSRHFEVLLGEVVNDPERRVSELPLMGPDERRTLLAARNERRVAYRDDASFHALFQEQARRTPDAVALVFQGRNLTFSQLDRKANQVANALLARGVAGGAEARVALCVARSIEMVIGVLGILKAGAAYVPMDPASPPERIALLLEAAKPAALLSDGDHGFAGVTLHFEHDGEIARAPDTDPGIFVDAGQAAYVIHTSGSTGRPKGVVVSHRSMIHLHAALKSEVYADVAGPQRVSLNAPLSFDASVQQLVQLLSGHAICVIGDEDRADPDALLSRLAEDRIDVFDCTPAHLRMLLSAGLLARSDGVPSRVLVGGDAIDPSTWAQLAAAQRTHFYNVYGPTECTVDSTSCRIEGARPTIGWALPNVELYVFDAAMQPVPVGVPGELYIGGDGLARGYLDAPSLTAQRFVPHPYATRPGARLYATGDRVRYRTDGGLEFIGRTDHQVKIRGYRVEPGEVEAIVREHAHVREAVVVVREAAGGDKRLIAYVTRSDAAEVVSPRELETYARRMLPAYMAPSTIVVLEAMPLTANGKIDLRALPEVERAEVSPLERPRTPLEEIVAALWDEVLGRGQGSAGVGRNENFFEAGGHSLLATQLVSRLRARMKVELPLRALFDAPTVAGVAAHIAARTRTGSDPAVPALERAERGGRLPLSFAQQRLWFLAQMEPNDPSYNMPAALRIDGALDVEALRRTFAGVVERHETLRTTFDVDGDEPHQVIHPPSTWPLPVEDLSALSLEERESRVAQGAAEEARRPFDLRQGPLLRTTVLRLGAQEHVLLVTMHHVVSDGWSMAILIDEVLRSYHALAGGGSASLSPLAVQYADYARWQRQWLSGRVLEEQLSYWRERLSGAPTLELPADRPRPAVQRHRGAVVQVHLDPDLSRRLRALCRGEGITLFMGLLAAFQALLARYSGQTDIAVGSPIAGRTRAELEGLIGFFVNTLVLRTDLSGDPSFVELLGRVREVTLGAYAHQEVPFEKLVEVLSPVRDPSRTPLFQAMFALQNAPREVLRIEGLSVRSVNAEPTTSKFELSLLLGESGEGLEGVLEYDTDRFDRPTVERFAGHFATLLRGAVERPEQRLSALPLLGEEERERLLVAWNGARAAYPTDACVHTLFEDQARRTPDAVAVVFRGRSLTYSQLNRKANQLARVLRRRFRHGSSEERVVLCLERSLDMIVGVLGILKSGAAYVPLDPATPAERRAMSIEDVRPAAVLDRIDEEALERELDADLEIPLSSEQTAYIIYTSGSTGRPKGVMVSHRAMVHLHRALEATVHVDAVGPQRVSLNAPLSFDASVQQLVQLLSGHTICIVPDEDRTDIDALLARLAEDRLDVLDCTPAHLRLLLDAGLMERREGAPSRVWVGGEAIDSSMWMQLAHALHIRFYNVYGPTECTVDSTSCRIDSSTPLPSIGRAVPNAQLYILDAHMQLAPIGVPGEIYIGGDGLARGYWNRPELTAERFVPHPYATTPGARLYETGDRGRYTADGNVEFLGRTDDQVKLRGHRIEPGEIEATLRSHAGVRDAIVVLREDAGGDPRLVAYVTGSDEHEACPSPEALEDHVRRVLPAYMVPSAFVVLEAMPLTANGKVDRRALPAVETKAAAPSERARTPMEEIVAGLWEELLGRRVETHASFFEAGGHSLLATQLVSRIRARLKVELQLRALFEAPTVSGMASRIDAQMRERSSAAAAPLVPVSREGPLPLSFAQQRLWFLDQLEQKSAFYNISAAVHIDGALDAAVLERSLREVLTRHEALRTTFPAALGEPRQMIAPLEASPVLDRFDLGDIEPARRFEEARRRCIEEAGRPFDLERDRLLRASLFELGPGSSVLMLTMHHIASDGWSMGILIREALASYRAFANGAGSPLPPLSLQYADYAHWQRQWLSGAVLDAQLSYWKQQLNGLSPLALPTDHPRPPAQAYRGAAVVVRIEAELANRLRASCRREGVTLFMGLLAVFQALLARYSGQTDIAVGSPIAGRTRAELEGLIGFFVNTLVLRTDLSGDPSFAELLGRAREVTLGAYAHQDVPFEKLVEAISPARDPSRPPLFQVMLALQNAPRAALEMEGLTVRPVTVEHTVSKFELSLLLEESDAGLEGVLEYNTDLFERATAERISSHFVALSRAAVEHPELRISEWPLVGEREHEQLAAWNAARAAYPMDACFHTSFEEQARRTPDTVAVVFRGRSLTYSQLNRKANQLAHALRGHPKWADSSGGSERRVVLCLERSLDMIVGVLGILKAGAAYVPLDPALPPDRRAMLLEDIDPAVILERIDGAMLEGQPDTDPGIPTHAEQTAYIIYTSGSTGRPKGVMVSHRAMLHLHRALEEAVHAGASGPQRVSLNAPLSFDASVQQLVQLLSGHTLCIVPDEDRIDTDALLARLREDCVDVLDCTPAHLQMLLAAGLLDDARPTPSRVLVGGEAIDASTWTRLARAPHPHFYNVYGPTECTVDSTSCRIDDRTPLPSIGRALPNAQLYILDAHMQLAPIGVPGEIHIGGDGVARGYWNRPALTAERFVPHPYATAPGARLYKTGDRGRYTNEGNVEFLGRTDDQVKLRGYRIEPGEIEATLRSCAGVRDAVVVLREETSGDERLIAYVAGGADMSISDLESRARRSLPAYMVPSAFIVLDALPLTPNGKVDRRALPVRPSAGAERSHELAHPRSRTELEIMSIWADLLPAAADRARVNPDLDFFASGGHSLLAVRLLARIRERFGAAPRLGDFLRNATITGLAALLEGPSPTIAASPIVALRAGGARPPLFLVHAVSGSALAFWELAAQLDGDQPVYGLHAAGLDDGAPPHESVEAMARAYRHALRAIQPRGPYFLGGWSFGGLVAYEMAQQLTDEGERVALLALLDSRPPAAALSPPPDEPLTDTELLAFLALDTGTPLARDEATKPYIERLLRVYRANRSAAHRYVPRPYPGRVTLLRATEIEVHPGPSGEDATYGWSALAAVETHPVPGGHFSMMRPPHVAHVADVLRRLLSR